MTCQGSGFDFDEDESMESKSLRRPKLTKVKVLTSENLKLFLFKTFFRFL
jgi:hypothetical protein